VTPVYPWRARTGIALILSMPALAVCTLASYVSLPDSNALDVVNAERFREMRSLLPLRGTVGYLGDFGDDPDNTRAYYRTQYFLAPLVVARDQAHDLVIANFAPGSPVARLAAAHGLIVDRDFGNGTALLHRPPR
jgi:hypothetical protein